MSRGSHWEKHLSGERLYLPLITVNLSFTLICCLAKSLLNIFLTNGEGERPQTEEVQKTKEGNSQLLPQESEQKSA